MQNQEVIIRNPLALNEDALAECLTEECCYGMVVAGNQHSEDCKEAEIASISPLHVAFVEGAD